MWQYDFHLFYMAGKYVLEGVSPYTIYDFNPPFPLAVIFALIAWMPESVAYLVYLVGSGFLMWKVLGKRSFLVVLSFPVWFNLFVGQIDLQLALLASLWEVWALPLLIIKPQVGFVLAPWIIRRADKKRLVQMIVLGGVFLSICFIIRPTWLSEWMAATPSLAQYNRRDSNLYWLFPGHLRTIAVYVGALLVLLLGFVLKGRRESWAILHLLAPLTNIYSASVLAEWVGLLEVFLSWGAILLVGDIHSGAPLFVVGLSILVRSNDGNKWKQNLMIPIRKLFESDSDTR